MKQKAWAGKEGKNMKKVEMQQVWGFSFFYFVFNGIREPLRWPHG